MAGATVTGGETPVTTDADGKAVVRRVPAGTVRVRATKAGRRAVGDRAGRRIPQGRRAGRHARARRDRAAPVAKLPASRTSRSSRRGPRELKGCFADASGIKSVKLRLAKRAGGKCWYFSGKMETFRRTKCGTEKYFAIGERADWSYLLPARLGKGRYVLDAIAIDGAGNRTPLARGTTRVVFTVR